MSTTMKLAEFVSGIKYDHIPQKSIEAVRNTLLDSIGCALFGSGRETSRIINSFIKEQGGKQEATLWANNFKGPVLNVVMGNGSMVHSFDFDDYHNAKLHPGAVVVPTALAIAEKENLGGEELLAALVAGYEVMIRISLGTNPNSSRMRGWHLTGTCGTFGAAAAAGKLYNLDEKKIAMALGMAGTQSSGLWAFTADGSDSKRFHPGKAASSGILGAYLVQKGYKGPTKILEAEDGGFCKATSDDFSLERITQNLGKIYETEGVVIKPYACCASSHSSIDAALDLVKKNNIKPMDIEKIIVLNSSVVKQQCGFEYKPVSSLQAQMSLQYIIAVSIIDGKALVDQFSESRIADPAILELAKKVSTEVDPEIDQIYPKKWPGKVEMILKDKKRYTSYVDGPKGSPENPIGIDEVMVKFTELAKNVKKESEIARIVEAIKNLEKLSNIKNLTELL